MKHLIFSREMPPAPYAPGGIGTYVNNIATLLAEYGETVHVIGQRWAGAPRRREVLCGGRLIIHRVAPEDGPPLSENLFPDRWCDDLQSLRRTSFPNQWFSFVAAAFAEQLIEAESIDLVEGQEWEAPLYYLMLRRELGIAPKRKPPCLVHLHSPTEFIGRFNSCDPSSQEVLSMQRMEAYCIKQADALLCPSRYLARQCESHYRLARGSVSVIPLPIGKTQFIARDQTVWESGRIVYVGRLEARKGVLEWVDAAVQVAKEFPQTSFDFVGGDTPVGDSSTSMCDLLVSRIPAEFRHRFRFHGTQPQEAVASYLSRAMAAVVPSRWENFPNTCVEAMRSGLPVIATRRGGMTEMIEDGTTGWLAEGSDLSSMRLGLHDALRRCLSARPEQRREMGKAASAAVTRLCDNYRTTREHLALRDRIVKKHHGRSEASAVRAQSKAAATTLHAYAIGIVVWVPEADCSRIVFESLQRQTRAPAVIVLVGPVCTDLRFVVTGQQIKYVVSNTHSCEVAWRRGFEVAAREFSPLGWMFLDPHDELEPDALQKLGDGLGSSPELGIVSCWTSIAGDSEHVHLPLNPELPHLWMSADVARATVFRTDVIANAAVHRGNALDSGFDAWSLTIGALAEGWRALTYPATLARRECDDFIMNWSGVPAFRERRAELMRAHARTVAADLLPLLDTYARIAAVPPRVPSTAAYRVPPNSRPKKLTARGFKLALRRRVQRFSRKVLFRLVRALAHPSRLYRAVAKEGLTRGVARVPLPGPRSQR